MCTFFEPSFIYLIFYPGDIPVHVLTKAGTKIFIAVLFVRMTRDRPSINGRIVTFAMFKSPSKLLGNISGGNVGHFWAISFKK